MVEGENETLTLQNVLLLFESIIIFKLQTCTNDSSLCDLVTDWKSDLLMFWFSQHDRVTCDFCDTGYNPWQNEKLKAWHKLLRNDSDPG